MNEELEMLEEVEEIEQEPILYVLNLNEDNRILSACFDNEYIDQSLPRVEELPEGDIYDYLYLEDEYVYMPLDLSEESEELSSECPLEGVEE